MNVRGPPCVGVIEPGVGARLYRDETVAPLAVGQCPAGPREIWIERRGVAVDTMCVSAGGIGLPDFHECIRNRPAVLIQDTSLHDDPFAERLTRVLSREVVIRCLDPAIGVDRP